MVNMIASEHDVDTLLKKSSSNFLSNLADLTNSPKLVDKFEGITEAEKLEIMSAEVKNNASKMRQTINKISSQNAYIDLIEFCGVSKLKNFK